jgi:hypothetical protein
LDGTPLLMFAFGKNVRVASAPAELSRTRLLPPLNPVPAAFVLYVIVAALALAAVMNIAMPAIEAARTSRLITFILNFFSCCCFFPLTPLDSLRGMKWRSPAPRERIRGFADSPDA